MRSRSLCARSLYVSVVGLAAGFGLAGCTDTSSHHVAKSPGVAAVASYSGTPARVRRMTQSEYTNTISYVFGSDLTIGEPFAPLPRTDGLLASGASSAGMTAGEFQQLQRSASAIASQVVDKGNLGDRTSPRRDFLVPCKPQAVEGPDDACAAKFIRQTGRLLFRHALPDAMVTELTNNAHKGAADLKDFYAGLATVIEGMLLDPGVLLITDTTEADPARPGHLRLTSYALASRLSFFLWDAAPDDELLKAAESGALYTKKGRTAAVDRMLASPRLEAGVRAFFDDMFGFEEFAVTAKDPKTYPMITGQTLLDSREQTLRTVVDHLITRHGDYRDLFLTRNTFISPTLAPVYGVPSTTGWSAYEFPADAHRAGILSQISFLALHSHPARSSATKRGKALRELLLCQKVPPPPPNVDFSAVENPDPTLRTARERLTRHSVNPVCAGCHKITDPIGLALETFDGAGRYRETEKGAKLDTSGSLDGKTFASSEGLGQALHDHPQLGSCLVRRLYSFGTGGPLSNSDTPAVEALSAAFAKSGYRVPDLLRMIALSDAFAEVVEMPPAPVKTAAAGLEQVAK